MYAPKWDRLILARNGALEYVDCNLASGEMDYLVIFSVIIMDAKLGQGFIMNLVVFDL